MCARTQNVVSKANIHFNKRWSWAVETGDVYWHCEPCKATFELFPVTDEAWREHGIAEIALHKGKQVLRTMMPHYCEECGVTWNIDFIDSGSHVVNFGSCSTDEGCG